MKKIRIGIAIILAILFLLSGKCQAQQETKLVVVSSNETIEVGEEIEIGIAVENLNMAACEITLNWDTSKLEWISQKKDNIHVVDNRIQYIWYDSKGGSMPKTGEFVRFRFRSKEAGNVSFSAEEPFMTEREMNLQCYPKKQEWKSRSKLLHCQQNQK